jgi:hypothetical protein
LAQSDLPGAGSKRQEFGRVLPQPRKALLSGRAPLAVVQIFNDHRMMLILLAALAGANTHPAWWGDFQQAYKNCGLVFNVDGSGPVGDGVIIEEDFTGLILSTDQQRPQKPIGCIAQWAKEHGIKVRYRNF